MKRAQLLADIQTAGGFSSTERAAMIIRLMIEALRSEMTPGQARVFVDYLPEEFREEWYAASGYPESPFDNDNLHPSET